MTRRTYDPALRAEIRSLIDLGEAFKKRQTERARGREETDRKMDAIILNNDPLPPPDPDAA